jgi:hypothetical protein
LSARAAREDGDQQPVLAWRVFCAASLLIVCYAGVVGASRILADPEIPLDQRMLAPALVLVMTMAAVGLTLWWCSTRLELARVAVALALAAWWNAAALATRADSRYVMRWGSDFAGEQWRDSELLAWARTAGADKPLYTNWPAAVYFYLHRPSHEIPQKGDARTMAAFADTLRARGGRVLLFNVGTELLAPNDSLLNAPGLQTIAEFRDGVVMRSDP